MSQTEIIAYDEQPANGDPIIVYNGEESQCLGTGFESFDDVVRYIENHSELANFRVDRLHVFTLGAVVRP